MATPPILPYGQSPGPGTITPQQGSFTQGDQPSVGAQPVPGGDPDELKKKLIQVLTQASQQKQMPTPVPAPVPQMPQGQRTGQSVQKGSGAQAIIPTISGLIQGAVAHQKQKQLATAESDWNNLVSAMNSNNPQALSFILTDDKKLKNMAKALNQDWLNPEKTTVYKQALDNVMQQQQKKGQAAEGLKAMFQKLIHKANNPQLSDQQKMDIAKEIMGRAPVTSPQQDPKELTGLLTEEMKEGAAQKKQAETEAYNTYRDEQKQKFTEWSESNKQQFQQHMESMKELAAERRQSDHDTQMMKALGIRLSAEDARRMQITPSQMNTEVNSTLTSLRQQLSQASSQLKSLQTAAQKRSGSLWQKMISDSPDVSGAQTQVDNLKASVDYIEKNRSAIISGKTSLDDVVDQAQSIASGTPPGFGPAKGAP
jgi:hypothetical protein